MRQEIKGELFTCYFLALGIEPTCQISAQPLSNYQPLDFWFVLFVLISLYVAQAVLEHTMLARLTLNFRSSYFSLLSAGTIGVCHHTWIWVYVCIYTHMHPQKIISQLRSTCNYRISYFSIHFLLLFQRMLCLCRVWSMVHFLWSWWFLRGSLTSLCCLSRAFCNIMLTFVLVSLYYRAHFVIYNL